MEGEYERPELNRHVGNLVISGNDVDRPLPTNTPVEVTLRIDASRAVSVSAHLLLVDKYIESILTDKVLLDEDPQRIHQDLKNDMQRVRQMADHAEDDVERFEVMAEEIESDLRSAAAGDIERGDRAARLRKELANEVDELERRSETPRLIEALNGALVEAQRIVNPQGDATQRNRLALLREEAEHAIVAGHAEGLRRVRESLERLTYEVLSESPAFWVDFFLEVCELVNRSERASSAAPLLRQGRQALDLQQVDELRSVCLQLWRLLPREQQQESGLSIGIRN